LRAISVQSRALTHLSGLHLPRSLHGMPVLSRLKRGSRFSMSLSGWQRGHTRRQRPRFGLKRRMYVPHLGQKGLWFPGAMVNGGILSFGRRPRGLGNASGGCPFERGLPGGNRDVPGARGFGSAKGATVVFGGSTAVSMGAGPVDAAGGWDAGPMNGRSSRVTVPGGGFFRGRPLFLLAATGADLDSASCIIASIWSITERPAGRGISFKCRGGASGTGVERNPAGAGATCAGRAGAPSGNGYFLGLPRGRFAGRGGGRGAETTAGIALFGSSSMSWTAVGLIITGVPSLSSIFLCLGMVNLFRETVVVPFVGQINIVEGLYNDLYDNFENPAE
jgi:hypothetical protein